MDNHLLSRSDTSRTLIPFAGGSVNTPLEMPTDIIGEAHTEGPKEAADSRTVRAYEGRYWPANRGFTARVARLYGEMTTADGPNIPGGSQTTCGIGRQ